MAVLSSSPSIQRFSSSNPCPICGGYESLPRGVGRRCTGYRLPDGNVVCTREEHSHDSTVIKEMPDSCPPGWLHRLNGNAKSIQSNGKKNKFRTVETYQYKDSAGVLLYEVQRQNEIDEDGNVLINPKTGKPNKKFLIRRPNENGAWIYNLKGIVTVLYRLPELTKADLSQIVYITEGEKHADRLGKLGFVATTAPMGAGKWKDSYNETLRGRNCIILTDNDDEGKKHASKVALSLNGIASSVKILELPGLPPKGDVIEWLDAGGTADELSQLTSECHVWIPEIKPESAINTEECEPPKPLMREIPKAKPFPIDALGEILSGAVKAIQETVQTPLAICANSILAAAALAVQPYADVEIDGRIIPTSEFFLTVGQTGERKSAVDTLVLSIHRDVQKDRMKEYSQQLEEYEQQKKNNDEKTIPPPNPLFLIQEPTYEGLIKILENSPFSGLFADEGGRLLGGYAMNKDNQLKTAAGFSELWDGKPITRVRRGEDPILLYGRRLSIHLMVQPKVSQILLSNDGLEDQGLLSRFLVLYPESTCGTRFYRSINPYKDTRFQTYCNQIKDIMSMRMPMDIESRELTPRRLNLTPEAKNLWIQFHDKVETEMGKDGILSPIRAMANKAPEHAIRLAGILSLIDNPQSTIINEETMEQGTVLASFYLNEALRLFQAGSFDPQLELAQHLLDWLHKRDTNVVTINEVYQKGINPVRNATTARQIMKILENHGWAINLPEGAEFDGARRKTAWKIRRG